jgi:hypothetical protein
VERARCRTSGDVGTSTGCSLFDEWPTLILNGPMVCEQALSALSRGMSFARADAGATDAEACAPAQSRVAYTRRAGPNGDTGLERCQF